MEFACCVPMEYYPKLVENGYSYIELPGAAISQLPDAEINRYADIIQNGPVKCCGFNAALPPHIKITGPSVDLEAAAGYAAKLCARGARLGISAIGIGSPRSRDFPDGYPYDKALDQAAEFLRVFAREAAPYQIQALWEPLNHTESRFGLSLREGADLVRSLHVPNVGLVCDLFHMMAEQQTEDDLLYALPQIRHVHVSQKRGDGRYFLEKEGFEPYMGLLHKLLDSGYSGIISVEALDGSIEEGVERSIHVLKQI